MKTGIDIVDINRFIDVNDAFINKVYCQEERNYIYNKNNSKETMAGIYAAKEAFLKAVNVGILNGIAFSDICVCHDDNSRPYLKLYGNALDKLNEFGNNNDIYIINTKTTVVAICIIW